MMLKFERVEWPARKAAERRKSIATLFADEVMAAERGTAVRLQITEDLGDVQKLTGNVRSQLNHRGVSAGVRILEGYIYAVAHGPNMGQVSRQKISREAMLEMLTNMEDVP